MVDYTIPDKHEEPVKKVVKKKVTNWDVFTSFLLSVFIILVIILTITKIRLSREEYKVGAIIRIDATLAKVESNIDLLVRWKLEEMKDDSITKIILNHLPIAKPISSKDLIGVSSEYGQRKKPGSDKVEFHTGTDYRAKKGTPVLAAGAGIVKMARYNGGYGYMIEIDHSVSLIGYNPIKSETWYAHLSTIKVKVNDRVSQGDTIGLVGSTGNSTGPHLHYELWSDKRINPNLFF